MAAYLQSLLRTSQQIAGKKIFCYQIRQLNVMEYQGKSILQKNGVAVQKFVVVDNPVQTQTLLKKFGVEEYVVKAQILAGGRGLGVFDSGFKGGVHITRDPKDVVYIVEKMSGHRLRTKQTPESGIVVSKIMVAESVEIKRETYICILMDREHNGPVIVASPAGGMDIENVAEKSPHLIKTVPVDIFEGVTNALAEEIADFLEFKGELRTKAAAEIQKLWKVFIEYDATQIEINPFVETSKQEVISVDAKLQFDDNAFFKQKDIFDIDNSSQLDPREVKAAKHNLNYIAMTGNIGCLVNGAGLAMATMDIIKLHGGDPANFLDVGGGVNEAQIDAAFSILASDPNVKAILVNVFGGIVNCATVAMGIVLATKRMKLKIPMVVRLEGTYAKEAKKILVNSRLPIETASDLEDAAIKAISSVK